MSIHINVSDHILFEDPYVLVMHKPCGLMVEPDRNGHLNLLQQVQKYVKTYTSHGQESYAQHIHRLDRPVSGIVLFAKQKIVLKNLSEQFAERKVKKYYQALTTGSPKKMKDVLEGWHKKEKKKAIIQHENFTGSEKVLLNYQVENFSDGFFLWNIELHTGKYHQIRAQLASVGCPIIGDTLYGSDIAYRPNAIALHASKLIFSHPITNEKISIEKAMNFEGFSNLLTK